LPRWLAYLDVTHGLNHIYALLVDGVAEEQRADLD
jgi:hypothetical protein